MTALVMVLWIANVLLDTVGQLAFKAAAVAPNNGEGVRYWIDLFGRPWLWVGIISYVAEFLLWLAFLTLVPLSEGILLGSINIIAIMIVGRVLFNEKLTRMRVLGIVLVAAGVAVVGAF